MCATSFEAFTALAIYIFTTYLTRQFKIQKMLHQATDTLSRIHIQKKVKTFVSIVVLYYLLRILS